MLVTGAAGQRGAHRARVLPDAGCRTRAELDLTSSASIDAAITAHRPDGTWLFRGRRLTGFSNEEETAATFAGNAPWLLEDRLRLAGALYEAEPA